LMAIWNILLTFGIFYDDLIHFVFIWYIFFRFWYHVPRKIWQPWSFSDTRQEAIKPMLRKCYND
jgi:hypothetical protein